MPNRIYDLVNEEFKQIVATERIIKRFSTVKEMHETEEDKKIWEGYDPYIDKRVELKTEAEGRFVGAFVVESDKKRPKVYFHVKTRRENNIESITEVSTVSCLSAGQVQLVDIKDNDLIRFRAYVDKAHVKELRTFTPDDYYVIG